MSNVLRDCEILTGTSYLSLPKARRMCCAAGGATAFQNLSKKIFAKLAGTRDGCWGIAPALQQSSTSWSSPVPWRINSALCPPLPKADHGDPLVWGAVPHPGMVRDQDLKSPSLFCTCCWADIRKLKELCPEQHTWAGLTFGEGAGTVAMETDIYTNK